MSIRGALAVRSHFSLGESMLSPKEIILSAKEKGWESVSVVDTMSVSSMVELSKVAKAEDIKLIVGCRLRVVDDPTYRKPKKNSGDPIKDNAPWYPKVYVKNANGMKDLMKLLTKAHSEDYFYYVPRIGFNDLIEALTNCNLIFSTGDFYSILHREDYLSIMNDIRLVNTDAQTFVEVVPINTPLFDTLNKRALELCDALSLPPLLTMPVQYKHEADADALDVLSAITSNTKMAAPWRSVPFIRDMDMKDINENVRALLAMKHRLKEHYEFESGLFATTAKNVERLSNLCTYVWEKQAPSLPVMGENEMQMLIDGVKAGWVKRLGSPTMGYKPSKEQLTEYKERLHYELSVLKEMGFERYFLIVQDLVNWSKRSDILVGPGRGSVGGSLVAFLLGITDVDPIRFNLIFERFINPDRLDLPDADLDFMSSRRGEIVDYLVEKYGRDKVAGISNYSTLASASALRDAGRVHDLSQSELLCTRYVPKEHGQSVTLTEAADLVPEIAKFQEKYEEIWGTAIKLEGRMRSMGQHAAGVVVAGEAISNRAVVETRANKHVTNWDKRSVEDWGLIKLDILGLSTLDIISKAINTIEKRWKIKVDLLEKHIDIPEVLAEFGKGKTAGIFQFESSGMRKLLTDLAKEDPLSFNDLVAATALYRPGPMDAGLLDDYVSIKQGFKEPEYEHENMRAALEPTHSVIVYQEQVMQLARDLAGFSMTDADHLRKAMGKKDMDMMMKQRDKWVDGCKSHSGMDSRISEMLFDKIEKFAGYAFNASHSVEYSIISYWSMWLKFYYPAEFYSAALSVVAEEKLATLVKDAESYGVLILPPDVNHSGLDFVIEFDKARDLTVLYTPFNRLKGLSDNTTRAILEGRAKKGGPFESKEDFLLNVNKSKVNKRHQDVLSRVGAFCSVEPTEIAARHPDRLKDQLELMPGLIIENVKADRGIVVTAGIKGMISKVILDYQSCTACSLKCAAHPATNRGTTPKIMVVTDSPNWTEVEQMRMFKGKGCDYLKAGIDSSLLKPADCYFTSLVKAPKEKGGSLTNEMINGCSQFIDREVEILKPPVIVALGGASIRHFVPDAKGGFAELCGQVVYVPKLDASIIFGISPMMCHFEPSRIEMLEAVFETAASMVMT